MVVCDERERGLAPIVAGLADVADDLAKRFADRGAESGANPLLGRQRGRGVLERDEDDLESGDQGSKEGVLGLLGRRFRFRYAPVAGWHSLLVRGIRAGVGGVELLAGRVHGREDPVNLPAHEQFDEFHDLGSRDIGAVGKRLDLLEEIGAVEAKASFAKLVLETKECDFAHACLVHVNLPGTYEAAKTLRQ